MAYIINQSCDDPYKPTSGMQWIPEYLWTSDRPQKQASAKADHLAVVYWQLVGLLMELSSDDEIVLYHSVRKWQVVAKQVTKYG